MISLKHYLICALASLSLGACDIIRFPGDGGPPPEAPQAGPELPDGAPGPPPPSAPVADPYDTGEPDTADPIADPVDTDSEAPTIPIDDSVHDGVIPDDLNPVIDETPTEEPINEPDPIIEPVFSYNGPGRLLPGSGFGETVQIVHAPDITFPIKSAPTYLQSMVFSLGGGVAGGDQCDARNYAYPWRDNFCETRSSNRNSPFCPQSRIHQGQDIRVGSAKECNTLRRTSAADRALHEVVAAEDGIISNVGTYSVNIRSGGHIYKYMHMNMKKLEVTAGQQVTAGQTLGYVSNDFGGTPTTFHLHFEIVENTAANGWAHVSPYLSLVQAYERRENGPGEELVANVAVASAPITIPDGFEIVE